MKWIKKFSVFIIRVIFIMILAGTLVARNIMAGLNLAEIENILRILNQYEDTVILQNNTEMFMYNLLYKVNNNFSLIMTITIIAFIIFEAIIILRRKQNE